MAAASHHGAGKRLLLSQFSSLRVVPFRREAMSAWRLVQAVGKADGAVFHLDAQPAYFAMIYLGPVTHCDLLRHGEALPPRSYDRGSICLVDLSDGAEIRLSTDLDAVGVILPFSLVDEVALRFPELRVRPRLRRNAPDPVVHKLGLALVPFLSGEDDQTSPALQHIIAALCIQLVADERTFH